MAHEEFPQLTEQAKHVVVSIMKDIDVSLPGGIRPFAAAVIREAVKQAAPFHFGTMQVVAVGDLLQIAQNLHDPLPPLPTPPTREQMEEALRSLLNSLDCHPGSQLAQEAAILAAGIAHHCKVQP